MNNKLEKYILIISMLFLVTACAQFGQHGTQNTENNSMTQNARTHSDHETLAQYYDDEARQMETKAEEKKQALEHYENRSYLYGRGGQDFASHTKANIRYYKEAASEAVRQASFHRKIAADLMERQSEMQAESSTQTDNQAIKTELNPNSRNKL